MASDYPFTEDDYSHTQSATTEFHDQPASETDLENFQFEVSGRDYTFRPIYYPQRVNIGKERDVSREKGVCRNEYVKDIGTKNREIHVVGYVTAYQDPQITEESGYGDSEMGYKNNLQSFHDMCDFGQRGDLISMGWSGEVLLKDSEFEGPKGIDTKTGHFLYEYTLDFVSTGRDEMGTATTGIIDEGN